MRIEVDASVDVNVDVAVAVDVDVDLDVSVDVHVPALWLSFYFSAAVGNPAGGLPPPRLPAILLGGRPA